LSVNVVKTSTATKGRGREEREGEREGGREGGREGDINYRADGKS
jgi:hypothetical protein